MSGFTRVLAVIYVFCSSHVRVIYSHVIYIYIIIQFLDVQETVENDGADDERGHRL
jgi:hypothetical protein